MKEIFKDIKGYEGLYQVSNTGEVRSLNYRRTGRIEILKTTENSKGYLMVMLCKNGCKRFFIHRLVAEAFLPKEDGKNIVNHKIEGEEGKKKNIVYLNDDGSVDKENSTIEWCDKIYNQNYGTCIERISKKNTNGKLSKMVLQFSKSGEFIKEWPSVSEVERQLGYCEPHISECCLGKRKTAYGFIWKYS